MEGAVLAPFLLASSKPAAARRKAAFKHGGRA
jgi:hypothetical protein